MKELITGSLLSPFYFIIPKSRTNLFEPPNMVAASVCIVKKEVLTIHFNEDYEVLNYWFLTETYCRENYMYLTTEENRDRIELTVAHSFLSQLKLKHSIDIELNMFGILLEF